MIPVSTPKPPFHIKHLKPEYYRTLLTCKPLNLFKTPQPLQSPTNSENPHQHVGEVEASDTHKHPQPTENPNPIQALKPAETLPACGRLESSERHKKPSKNGNPKNGKTPTCVYANSRPVNYTETLSPLRTLTPLKTLTSKLAETLPVCRQTPGQ